MPIQYEPNADDLSIIKELLDSVSWGDECALYQALDGSKVWLICEPCVLVPCHWQDFEARSLEARQAGELLNTKPGLLLHGECGSEDWGRVNWLAHEQGFATYWLGVQNQIRYGKFINHSLDGVEWWNLGESETGDRPTQEAKERSHLLAVEQAIANH